MKAPIVVIAAFFAIACTEIATVHAPDGGASTDAGKTDAGSCTAGCPLSDGRLARAGAFQCIGNSVEQCVAGAGGCLAWGNITQCTGTDSVCQQGKCVAACQDLCQTNGATQCVGNGVETCNTNATNGCLEWSQPVACQTGAMCQNGTCGGCINQCSSANSVRCVGNSVQTCDKGADGCLAWSTPVACGSGQQCSMGVCSTPACMSQCKNGDVQCQGNGVETCVADSNGDGCFSWTAPTDCGAMVCQSGQCVSTCTDECQDGTKRCASDGSGTQLCAKMADGCEEWGPTVTCGAGVCVTDTSGNPFCAQACTQNSQCPNDSPCCAPTNIAGEGACLGAGQPACMCQTDQDCGGNKPNCAPLADNQDPNTVYVCKPNDGNAWDGCDGAEYCSTPFDCWTDNYSNEFCAQSCSSDEDCAGEAGTCCNPGTCSNYIEGCTSDGIQGQAIGFCGPCPY